MIVSIIRKDIADSIEEAKSEMELAKNRLDHAATEMEIDIAIYSMIAAEKKIDMLFKMAKESLGKAQ
ncbi:hypothetical protein [Clostridium formicaceticum]|uniref:DUF2508 domain-containing protein n=1 Tax=Clostridium formicaceticum TaxID=1497 RepID=A0AAC9RLX1_9CLOT|nr:hypothetical protein [Clostridium formicaceticum]AOY77223.1 hypothetical protein BJL90_16025 [Clostridium formicaceticum]ARE87753.1 hypothetical protein CLFO_21530 [Clostridium formicaceticum]